MKPQYSKEVRKKLVEILRNIYPSTNNSPVLIQIAPDNSKFFSGEGIQKEFKIYQEGASIPQIIISGMVCISKGKVSEYARELNTNKLIKMDLVSLGPLDQEILDHINFFSKE